MLKKTASFVLAALRGSPYGHKYASPPRLLRPRWTVFLTILLGHFASIRDVLVPTVTRWQKQFFYSGLGI